MAVVHTESTAIFGKTPMNSGEEKVQYVEYRPTFAFDGKSAVEFTIPGNTGQYVSLRDSYIMATVQIRKQLPPKPMDVDEEPPKKRRKREAGDGPNVDEDMDTDEDDMDVDTEEDEVNEELKSYAYPIDAIFHTMWNGVDVFMNQQ